MDITDIRIEVRQNGLDGGFYSMQLLGLSAVVETRVGGVDQSMVRKALSEVGVAIGIKYLGHLSGILQKGIDELDRRIVASEALLHPIVKSTSYTLYKQGHFREAVLNSTVAIFDRIRAGTGIDDDGEKLDWNGVLPICSGLVFSNLETESGRNDQKGFIQILEGAYQGIPNPKSYVWNMTLHLKKHFNTSFSLAC